MVDGKDYVLFHSPANGIGVKRPTDHRQWRDEGLLTLGQAGWPWAQGRLTAGLLLDLRRNPAVGKALMFFHGSDFPERDPRVEYLSAYHASQVYRLLGKTGPNSETAPPVGEAMVKSDVDYHNRPGGHSLEMFDGLKFLEFAECHLKSEVPPSK